MRIPILSAVPQHTAKISDRRIVAGDIGSVYPELLGSHHKLVVESVLVTGFPRSIVIPPARKLFICRIKSGLLAIFETGEVAVSPFS